jgi:hypothetical protein
MRRVIPRGHANLYLPSDITFFNIFSSVNYCLRIQPLIFVSWGNELIQQRWVLPHYLHPVALVLSYVLGLNNRHLEDILYIKLKRIGSLFLFLFFHWAFDTFHPGKDAFVFLEVHIMRILRVRRFPLLLILLVWLLYGFSLDAPSTLVTRPALPTLSLLPTAMVIHLLQVVMLPLHGLKALVWLLSCHLLGARVFLGGLLLELLWLMLSSSWIAVRVLIERVLFFFLLLLLLPNRSLVLNFLLNELRFLRQAILCWTLIACIIVFTSFLGSEEWTRIKRTIEGPSCILTSWHKNIGNWSLEIWLASWLKRTTRIIDWAMLTFLFEAMNCIIVADSGVEWR